jgi:hypothetical protein
MELIVSAKNTFVADGPLRFLRGRQEQSSESIVKKHAKELANANPAEKLQIRERMAREFLSQKNLKHKPSPGTLW